MRSFGQYVDVWQVLSALLYGGLWREGRTVNRQKHPRSSAEKVRLRGGTHVRRERSHGAGLPVWTGWDRKVKRSGEGRRL